MVTIGRSNEPRRTPYLMMITLLLDRYSVILENILVQLRNRIYQKSTKSLYCPGHPPSAPLRSFSLSATTPPIKQESFVTANLDAR